MVPAPAQRRTRLAGNRAAGSRGGGSPGQLAQPAELVAGAARQDPHLRQPLADLPRLTAGSDLDVLVCVMMLSIAG